MVLVRPETLELAAATNGDAAGANVLAGEVLTHTFLGPVTRVKVVGPAGELIADLPTARAEALPPGARVTAHVPADTSRLLTLADDQAAAAAAIGEDTL
jgi:putative spermidine/putrescine transport system ATP-binding protein